MEIQNPFQIQWERCVHASFADFLFAKIAAHGNNLAMVDSDTGKQWRYSELKQWVWTCAERLREIGVTSNSRVSVITSTTGQAAFVHLACATIGCPAVGINGWMGIDEIWQQVDISESTHCIAEAQFVQKVEDVRRKAQMRGGGRIRQVLRSGLSPQQRRLKVRTLDEVLCSERIDALRSVRTKQINKPPLPAAALSSSLNSSTTADPLSPCEDSAPLSPHTLSNTSKNEDGDELTDQMEESTMSAAAALTHSATFTPFLMLFTSGTTGLPKVVELHHKSLIVNVQQLCSPIYGPVQQKERMLLPLALSHIFGVISLYYGLVNGATVITMSKWTAKSLLHTIEEYRINLLHSTPAMVGALSLLEVDVEERDLDTFRSLVCGGAPLDPNQAMAVKAKLGIKDLRQVYGMTELGGVATFSHSECEHVESVGQPLPGMLFKIVNWETKQICQPNQPGQLLVQGPQVMPVYFKNPKATSEIVDSLGYVRTGDAAFYDENGYVYILDRIKDIIKYKGTLVCPSEVEIVLRSHPAIEDCAVVGRQDHVAGEVPAAFVVKSNTVPLLSSAEVRQHVIGRIAQFKELRGGVFFISEIPRSICGKVLRRQLRQHWDRERANSKVDPAAAAAAQKEVKGGEQRTTNGAGRLSSTTASRVRSGASTPRAAVTRTPSASSTPQKTPTRTSAISRSNSQLKIATPKK